MVGHLQLSSKHDINTLFPKITSIFRSLRCFPCLNRLFFCSAASLWSHSKNIFAWGQRRLVIILDTRGDLKTGRRLETWAQGRAGHRKLEEGGQASGIRHVGQMAAVALELQQLLVLLLGAMCGVAKSCDQMRSKDLLHA